MQNCHSLNNNFFCEIFRNSHRNSSGGTEINSKQSSIEDYDVLDCGKPVQKTTFDELMGELNLETTILKKPNVQKTF